MIGWLRKWWWTSLLLALLGLYWLLPISGQVVVIPEGDPGGLLWPQMWLDPASPRPGQHVALQVRDSVSWSYVLLAVEGRPAQPEKWPTGSDDPLVWEWSFTVPDDGNCSIVFYRDCHTGCVERGRMTIETQQPTARPQANPAPTKLGLVFANPERDWHGRSGWDVELTYALMAEEEHWGIDDLAVRVHQATTRGLRVLVRVDYDYGQSLPPTGDYLALSQYLQYLQRLARDERLRDVYGYFLGSSYNSPGSNTLAPAHPVTPEWYARLFNGYGEEIAHADNAVQVMRAENPHTRLLVGPVQPWATGQDGERRYEVDAPWLNYMNTLVAAIDEGARAKAAAGVPLTAPDGFAIQAPGRTDAPELAGRDAGEEPRLDLRRVEWDSAQVGFRVYRDWLGIINDYSTTRGTPVYITSANTFAPDEAIPPAQNYPRGWLTAALEVINEEPQIKALCWFLDYFPHDTQWEYFSLTRQSGRLLDAAEEFDLLLRREL